jgi:SNF2 family DNA or RNA helicase
LDHLANNIPPWKHQIEALNLSQNKPAFYFAMGMGSGKSRIAVDSCNNLNARSVLIVCPKKVIPVWKNQFELYSKTEYKILSLTKGSTIKKAKLVEEHIKKWTQLDKAFAVVTNYESFWRAPLGPTMKNNRFVISTGVLTGTDWDMLICDEAHHLKSAGGRASWGMKRLAKKARYRRFLSGTPFPHSPLCIYAQYRSLAPEIFGTSYTVFKNRYAVVGGFENRQVIGFQNIEELQQKFYQIAYHVKTIDVLDLPETQDIVIECELDPKVLKIYRELEKEFVVEIQTGTDNNGEPINSVLSVQNALDKLLRLSQITAGIIPLNDGGVKMVDTVKIDTIIEIIKDIPIEEPIVIFYRFKLEAKILKEKLLDLKRTDEIIRRPCEISGRIDEQEDFYSGKADVAVVQLQAGSEGLDGLKKARYCFYTSLSHSLGQFEQSKARIHRPGQTRKVLYYYVLAKGTVDKKIFKALAKKREVISYVLKKIKFEAIEDQIVDLTELAREAAGM